MSCRFVCVKLKACGSGGTNGSRGSRVGANGSPRKGQGFGGCFKSMAPYVGSILLVYKIKRQSRTLCVGESGVHSENETVLTAGLSDYQKLLPFTIEIRQSEGANSRQSRLFAFYVEFSWWRQRMPSELLILWVPQKLPRTGSCVGTMTSSRKALTMQRPCFNTVGVRFV